MRAAGIAAAAALAIFSSTLSSISTGVRAQGPAESAEDRLLRAELLEVSSGDIEKAMAIYEAVQADEKAPEAVRARALLYLARCQRKLGQIEKAKSVLETLVRNEAAEREVVRQARGFLEELRGGKPANPEFDWLKELEKSPEIRARVFELAMDLAFPGADAFKIARKQLIALGPLAAPVLEQLIETSRDPVHRQHLAIILLHSGRYDRIAVVLDPAYPPGDSTLREALEEFVAAIPALEAGERARLLAALEKSPAGAAVDPYREAIKLWADAAADLPASLRSIEPLVAENILGARSLLRDLSKRDAAVAAAMAERMLDPGCPREAREHYFLTLQRNAPEKLGDPQWVVFSMDYLEGRYDMRSPNVPSSPIRDADTTTKEPYHSFRMLESRGAFTALQRLAAGALKYELVNYFWYRHAYPGKLAEAPVEWAPVLRAIKDWQFRFNIFYPGGTARTLFHPAWILHHWAELSDSTVGDFTDLLKNRMVEAPAYNGLDGRDNLGFRPDGWRPSARYCEAMAGLLAVDDPVAAAIALEALALAPAGTGPEVEPAIEKLLAETADLHLREFALYALIRRSSERPGARAAAARALLGEFEKRAGMEELPEAYNESPLGNVRLLGVVGRQNPGPRRISSVRRVAGRTIIRSPRVVSPRGSGEAEGSAGTLSWIIQQADEGTALALYPHVLDLAGSEAGAAHLEWFSWQILDSEKAEAGKILAERLDSLSGREAREAAIGILVVLKITGSEPDAAIEQFLRKAALDRDLSVEARKLAASHHPDSSAWFDWARLIREDDPILGPMGLSIPWNWLKDQPDEARQAVFRAALESPREEIRESALVNYPLDRPEVPEVLRKALADPAEQVRNRARSIIIKLTRADAAPLIVGLLDDPQARLDAINALKRFASPESLEPLGKLLEDPDVGIRNAALAALKEIRSALEEKREWQELIRTLKESKKPAEKPAEQPAEKTPEENPEKPPEKPAEKPADNPGGESNVEKDSTP